MHTENIVQVWSFCIQVFHFFYLIQRYKLYIHVCRECGEIYIKHIFKIVTTTMSGTPVSCLISLVLWKLIKSVSREEVETLKWDFKKFL